MRLDPDDAGAAGRQAREVEAGAAPDVEQVGAGQGVQRVDGGVDDPGAVGRAVLQLVDVRGVPDVRAADHDERRAFDPLGGVLAAAFLVGLRRAPWRVAWRRLRRLGRCLLRRLGGCLRRLRRRHRVRRLVRPGNGCGGPLAGHSGPAPSHGAGRHGRGVHEQRDELPGPGRAGPLDGVEVRLAAQHELGVALLAHERGELGAVAAVDRLGVRRAPRCWSSSTSRGRGRRVPSRGGRTRRSSPRGRTCRRVARRCGRTVGSAAASRRPAWPRAAAGR